jgi:magnesium chelatase family protein
MSLAEAINNICISVASRTGDRAGLVMTHPCCAPHHTISDVGLIGGGQVPRSGDVSLAYHGILCLDELLECKRHVLEVLRQPLEHGRRLHPPHHTAGYHWILLLRTLRQRNTMAALEAAVWFF